MRAHHHWSQFWATWIYCTPSQPIWKWYCSAIIMQEPRVRGGIAATSALDGVEWSLSRLGHTLSQERATSTYWIGGWVDLIAGLDTEARRTVFCFCWRLNLSHSVNSQTLYLLSYTATASVIACYVAVYRTKAAGTIWWRVLHCQKWDPQVRTCSLEKAAFGN
jgi:hypothetical protein